MQPAPCKRAVLSSVVLLILALFACKQSKEKSQAPAPSASAPLAIGPCPLGQSADPNQAEFRPAVDAFKAKEYAQAQGLLDTLMSKYANSATLRVWRGDAALFDKKAEYKKAAADALVYYKQAEELHDKGCKLPEVEHYYLRLDFALASLRRLDADSAIRQLEIAKREWSDAADIFYNLARAHCMKAAVDACYENFEQTLKIAKSLKRPRFLRSHNSLDDWIRRSKTQSEFPPLRRDKRYAPLIAKMNAEK